MYFETDYTTSRELSFVCQAHVVYKTRLKHSMTSYFDPSSKE